MAHRPRSVEQLNPFAFPAETDIRFTLLMVAAIAFVLMIGFLLPLVFEWEIDDDLFLFPETSSGDANISSGESSLNTQSYLNFFNGVLVSYIFPTLGLLFMVFVLTTITYRSHSFEIRLRKKLTPFPPEKDIRFHHEIEQLVKQSKIMPIPEIMLKEGFSSQNGQAFGFKSRYILRLDGGLRVLLRKAPHIFQAVVLHELAHIANRDIGRTYLTQAIWRAVVVVIFVFLVIPLGFRFVNSNFIKPWYNETTISGLISSFSFNFLLIGAQVGVMLLVVAIMRTSVLRVRELYADRRAALWGVQATLIDILNRSNSKQNVVFWLRFWQFHPTVQERITHLKNPTEFFRLKKDLPFLVGLLLAVVAQGVILLLLFGLAIGLTLSLALTEEFGKLDSGSFWLQLEQFVALITVPVLAILALIIAFSMMYLVSGTVGLKVQQEAIADKFDDHWTWVGYTQLWLPAALMASGFEAGFLIVPFAVLSPFGRFWGVGDVNPIVVIPLMIAATVVNWLCLVYVRFFGWYIYNSHSKIATPKWKRRLLNLSLSCLLTIFYIPLILWRLMITAPMNEPENSTIFNIIIFLTLISISLYIFIFGTTWAFLKVSRIIRPPLCPHCKKVTQHKVLIGKVCEHCNRNLMPWLFVDASEAISEM